PMLFEAKIATCANSDRDLLVNPTVKKSLAKISLLMSIAFCAYVFNRNLNAALDSINMNRES
ncbi:hypothetical protein DERP_013568, partial [Dermatophagoides pteronyssinus]